MNLRDLHYLVAVSELRSFGKAAEKCFISQPTLSMQIKKLEEDLGVKMFERTNKKVMTTDTGEQIVAVAAKILRDVQLIKELAALSQDPLAGNFRLGAFPTLAAYIFPQLVTALKEHLPNIRAILIEEKTGRLLEQLTQGEIDAALLSTPIEDSSLHSEILFRDPFKLAVNADHPLAKFDKIEQSQLRQFPLLLLDEGHCLRGQALQICQLHHIEEQTNVRATGLETLRQMVRAGTGITFFPQIAIRKADTDLRYLDFEQPVSREIALVWRKTAVKKALLGRLVAMIRGLHEHSVVAN